jgi:hypothetical protein
MVVDLGTKVRGGHRPVPGSSQFPTTRGHATSRLIKQPQMEAALLHECFPPLSPLVAVGMMDARKECARRDCGTGDQLVGKLAHYDVEIKLLPSQRDEDAGIDQLGHTSFGTSGW